MNNEGISSGGGQVAGWCRYLSVVLGILYLFLNMIVVVLLFVVCSYFG